MSSNYQQKKMMNALGAIDTKGNIVLEQFQDGTSLAVSTDRKEVKPMGNSDKDFEKSNQCAFDAYCKPRSPRAALHHSFRLGQTPADLD